ncbi:MAG: hypothetical protein ABW087_20320 [Candidatus Thiodiazotropha sp.]
MSDEQRRVAHFQAQPEGLGLFFHPAALSFAHLARLNLAHSALLGKKTAPAESIGLVLTGPRWLIWKKTMKQKYLDNVTQIRQYSPGVI